MQEDWTEISDAALRKRIQNRLAQRKHRRKTREQLANHSDAPPPTTSTTPTSVRNPTTSDTFYPALFATSADPVPDPKSHLEGVFDTPPMEDPTGEFFTMQGFARPQWNPGNRTDGHGDATISGTDRQTAVLARGTQRSPLAPGAFGTTSSWNLISQQESDTQDHLNRLNQPHSASQGFPDNAPISPQATSAVPVRRRYGQHGTSARVDHSDSCSECGAQQRPCHRRAHRPTEDNHADAHVCTERRPSTASAPAHRHVSPSSSLTHSSRSDLLGDQYIDINQILSHIEPDRRGLITTPSGGMMTPHSQPLYADSIVTSSNRRAFPRQEPFEHHVTLGGGVQEDPNEDYLERSGPRVRKVVVIYMDERDHE